MITAERLREVLSYDPETGSFRRLEARGNAGKHTPVGSDNGHGYLQVMIDGRLLGCHRLAWLYMTGKWQIWQIDHINGNRTDNRWTNLRDVPARLNQQNRRIPRPDNRSGLIGVCLRPNGRFAAQLAVDDRRLSLGTFDTREEAHAAYVAAKRKHHPGCTL